MLTTVLPYVETESALLWLEPRTGDHLESALTFEGSSLCVTRADHPRDLYQLRDGFDFCVAVLSDKIGIVALRASAETVRAQWPKARILILGKVPNRFDDHLYDEAVVHGSDRSTLTAVLTKLSKDFGDSPAGDLTDWLNLVSRGPVAR